MQCITVRCLPPAATCAAKCAARQQRASRLVARSFEPEIDGPGVGALLERDLKKRSVELSDEALSAFGEEPAAAGSSGNSTAAAAAAAQQEEQAPREEQQRGPASKRADKLRSEAGTPKRCREAIDLGLQKFSEKKYQEAIDLFQLSLELPGSGVMRLSGSVREYSCASEGEENAALYNMACCWAALGQRQAALTVLEALIENNFEDYNAIRTDPDLASLRGPELDKLLSKHDGFMAKLFGGKKKTESSNKPWLQW